MPAHRRSPAASGSSPDLILAAHLATILGGGLALALAPSLIARGVGALASGTSLFALSGLLRESAHGRLARRPRLNNALGLLVGAPILLPPSAYRAFEADHHRAPNSPDDPHRPLNHRAMLLLGLPLYVLLCHKHAFGTLGGRGRSVYLVETLAVGVVMSLALAAFLGLGLGWVVVGPILVAATWHNLRIVAGHLDRPAGRFADTWQLALPRPLSRWLLHADHHLEAHLRPDVRWSDLPLIRAEVDRGGFLPEEQRPTLGRFARAVLIGRVRDGRTGTPSVGGELAAVDRPWAGRAAIRARRRQPNHPSRDSVGRLASE